MPSEKYDYRKPDATDDFPSGSDKNRQLQVRFLVGQRWQPDRSDRAVNYATFCVPDVQSTAATPALICMKSP